MTTRYLANLAGALLLAATCALQAQGVDVSSREVLGTGDVIRITVFQNPDLTREERISERGTIQYPLIGEVALAGQTPTAAAGRIAEQLVKGTYLKNPQVTVSLVQLRSRQVSVLGQVVRPGRYALEDANARLTDILALAGGLTPMGDDNVTVILSRGGETKRLEVDVPKMYRSGDLTNNLEVQPGDMIYVQRAPVFYIYGEVQRAGAYRLDPGLAVMHAITLGGGLTPRGTERGLKIHRRGANGKVQKLDAQPGDLVKADDVIYVRESIF